MQEEKYYKEIKNILVNNEVYKKVKDYSKNRSDLLSYYNVGKLIVEAQGGEERAKYGDNLIKKYSKRLTNELGKGYSIKNLKRMRQYYLFFQKRSTVSTQLTWSHYSELLSLKDTNAINFYINISEQQNLSVRQLRERIKQKEYERLPGETKTKLIAKKETSITDYIKDPIIINAKDKEIVSEKILKNIILENMDAFLEQLGPGYSYVKNEYKIRINDRDNFIDILLFNYIYNAFAVIELKTTELKKEHIGQVEIYKNYIDMHLKTINQNNTIGIIIYKKGNKYLLHYCTDKKIYAVKYITIAK